MKTTVEIDVIERDRKRVPLGEPRPKVTLVNHRNYKRDFVILEFGEECLTVPADKLRAAIDNCTNTR